MPAIAEAQLEHCIDKLYGALTAPHTLTDAIRAVRLTLGASGATHLYINPRGELLNFVDDGHDPESQRLYVEHYALIDPTRQPLLKLPAGEWLRDDRLLDPRHTTGAEFVNDFAPRIGMRWFLACKLFEGAGGTASFSLQRGRDAPPFDNDTLNCLRQLQPHLKRVFRMMLELAPAIPAITSAGAAMDMLHMPVCVVDGDCRVVYANPAAEELFARADAVTVRGGRLGCPRPDANAMLRRAVTLANRPPRRASSFSPAPPASPAARLQVRAVPLVSPLAHEGDGNLVLLFLATDSAPPQAQELQELFSLTRAEAELVEMLARGASPKLCALRRGVSVATVRTQLKSIYAKTGAASQAQLLSMVLALPGLR